VHRRLGRCFRENAIRSPGNPESALGYELQALSAVIQQASRRRAAMTTERPVPASKSPVPGSARKGDIDVRSTDARGKQADEVESHAERAKEEGSGAERPKGEAEGAMKDQTGR
jgi:hypothetical protein